MKTSKKSLCLLLIAVFPLLFTGCSKDDPETSEGQSEIVYNTNVELPTDEGEIGFVIDTREIFRMGYFPVEAIVEFQDYQEFNSSLEIDAITNFAILRIPNEDLTNEQKEAMGEGVAIEISIFDAGQQLLASYQGSNQILDDSNTELIIETNLPKNYT